MNVKQSYVAMDPSSLSGPCKYFTGKRVYIALEGGGAKAIAHVGLMRAIYGAGCTFENLRGVSGTSAGALVAALIAAGYTPDELLDEAGDHTILDKLENVNTPTDLFAGRAWRRISALRVFDSTRTLIASGVVALCVSVAPFLFENNVARGALLCLAGFLMLLSQVYAPLRMAFYPLVVALAPVAIGAELGAVAGVLAMLVSLSATYWFLNRLSRGMVGLEAFHEAMSYLLALRIRGDGAGEVVRFKDFGPGTGRPSLKIVATNISRGRLELFSPLLTPEVAVADAVAASGCIPVAFKPWRIQHGLKERNGDRFLDGGLVSNLPAWTFDGERVLDPDSICVLGELGLDVEMTEPEGVLNWAVRVVRTVIFGSKLLNTRGVYDEVSVAEENELGVLDFDLSPSQARRVARNAERLATERFMFESQIAEAPRQIREIADAVLRSIGALSSPADRVRVCVAVVSETAYANRLSAAAEIPLRLSHHAGFETSLDYELSLPLCRSCIGAVLRSGEAELFDLAEGGDKFLYAEQDRIARLRVAPDLTWILAVPITITDVSGSQRRFVVAVDCNAAMPEAGRDSLRLREAISLIEKQIGTIFAEITAKWGRLSYEI